MLQTRTVEPGTLELLKHLMRLPVLEPFFLVGGTALALQMGHRKSIDLDLFSPTSFDSAGLIQILSQDFEIRIDLEEVNMLITNLDGIKVDFVKMGYPILHPTLLVEEVRMLDMQDIAPMKLKAIAQRGSKKDFYDLYFLLKHMSLDAMLALFQQKFKMHEVFHIVKSLTYFEDADQSPNPVVFDNSVTWPKVKSVVEHAVKALG